MTELSRSDVIVKSVVATVNELVDEFSPNPYRFLCEADLQAKLFSLLRRDITFDIRIPRSAGAGAPAYCLHPACMEYHTFDAGDRIDIVCIDPERAEIAERRTNPADVYIFTLPPLVAIELKCLQMGYRSASLIASCEADWVKLQSMKENPDQTRALRHALVLGFVQDVGAEQMFAKAQKQLEPVRSVATPDGAYIIARDGLFKMH